MDKKYLHVTEANRLMRDDGRESAHLYVSEHQDEILQEINDVMQHAVKGFRQMLPVMEAKLAEAADVLKEFAELFPVLMEDDEPGGGAR